MIEIIPAIDIIGGKCVRLVQGKFSECKVYGEPLETAKIFEDAGFKRLHIVDLDGARTGAVANLQTLERIAKRTQLTIDFGGGIRSKVDLKDIYNAGASISSVGSVAVKEPEMFSEWLDAFGPECFLIGADVRGENLAVNGWQGVSEKSIIPFLSEYLSKGISQAFVTDIAKDGMLEGSSIELYSRILKAIPELDLIASGGVSSMENIRELEAIGCRGVIVGRAIYEGRVRLEELAAAVGG